MRRICGDEELRSYFGDGTPRDVSEMAEHFNISVAVAYKELKRLKAQSASANLLVLCATNTHKNAIIMKLLLTVKSYFICLI